MNAIGVFAALATIFAAGFGALILIVRGPQRLHLAEQMALAWLLGTGVVSLSLWLFGLFASREILFVLVTLVCVVLPFAAWKTRGPFRFQPLRRPSRLELVLAGLLAVEILAIGFLAFAYTLGWDGLLNWEVKARYAFGNGGVIPPAYFQDIGRAFSHPEYPLGIPFTELWIYLWVGEADQFWAKTIFPIYYASGVILLVAISARLTGKTWTGFIAAIALFFVPQITTEAGSSIVGYADFPLSAFYFAAIGYLLCVKRNDGADFFRIYAACLALLPWVKREGIILWVIAAVCGAFVIWRKKLSAKYFCTLLTGLCIAFGWRVWLSQMHAVSASDFMPVNFTNFTTNFHRLGPILSALIAEFVDTGAWGLFWFVSALATGYFVRQYRDARLIVFLVAVGAPIAAYAFIYVFSDWLNYQRHVGLSISRLLMHVAPLASVSWPVALAALPSFREVFSRSQISKPVSATTCEEQYPGLIA